MPTVHVSNNVLQLKAEKKEYDSSINYQAAEVKSNCSEIA